VLLSTLVLATTCLWNLAIAKSAYVHHGNEGNPCTSPKKPFPCRNSDVCIPLLYLCDDNPDCDDAYDEDPAVCTAAKRPPVEEIEQFLENEKAWIVPRLFGNKPISAISQAVAVSKTVGDLQSNLGLGDTTALCDALEAVDNGREDVLEAAGMPPKAWNGVAFFFSKLIKSGFHC